MQTMPFTFLQWLFPKPNKQPTSNNSDGIDIQLLNRFQPFQQVADDELLVLAKNLEIKTANRGEVLCEAGDYDDQEIFLISGKLKLKSDDGITRHVEGDSHMATGVIAKLRPRQYTISAVSRCEYLSVNRDILAGLLGHNSAETSTVNEYDIEEIPRMDSKDAQRLVASFYDDLNSNKFVLTSIPEVALRIRNMLDDPDQNVAKVAEVISGDPSIAAKIIKTSNSPFYLGAANCESVKSAIVRIGATTTRQLVLSFTVRHLFSSGSPLLKDAMTDAWQRSIEVGAIAYVLARRLGDYLPEEAMLAGLLSNIGVISVLNYLGNYPDIYQDPKRLQAAINELKAEVGGIVLERWSFPEDAILCARHCEDWQRENDAKADMCDLILVATLHALIGKVKIPQLDTVPAFNRVSKGRLTPELAVNFLTEAKEQIEQAKALLS